MEREADLEGQMNADMLTGFRDELVREAGVVTPGVDDSPYIHYAIEALTRDRDTGYSGNDSSSSYAATPIPPILLSRDMGYYHTPRVQEQRQYAPLPMQPPILPTPVYRHDDRAPEQPEPFEWPFSGEPPGLQGSPVPSSWAPRPKSKTIQPHEWRPMNRDAMADSISQEKASGFPPLHFLPWILRPASFTILMVSCLAMLAALMYCAVHSQLNPGLVPFTGTIYGSQYFVFRMLPQLLAAFILIYAQCIAASMFRIVPFLRLASNQAQIRDGALFQDLYPNSFLWPRLIGTWKIWVPILVTWLINITLPLQSSLFTVILVDGVWTWAAVQGVAWTLVALYVALLVATVIAASFWLGVRNTGLLWDPRSLADIVTMVSETNTAVDYQGTQRAGTRDRLRFALRRRRSDRLGYWAWKDGRPGFWYALGNSMDHENSLPFPDIQAKHGMKIEKDGDFTLGDRDVEASGSQHHIRYRYLPWCMRNNQLLYLVVTAFILLLALFVVSFLPSTHISTGFLPWLLAAPGQGAFSAADFLYSFLPSLVGLILWLLFQAVDLSIRVHQPWAALSGTRGARAEESLLADYAACLPIQSTIHAAKNGHWRVAVTSLLSTLFLLLPVLGGGMFMALTRPGGEVRMYPNMPAFAIILALLVLYFLALVGMFPGRKAFRLPHAVTCLAEIISFLANEDLLADLAFKQCRTKEDMLLKMGLLHGTPETQPRWMFGVGPASADGMPGVRRARRFTEKRPIRKSQIRRGGRDMA